MPLFTVLLPIAREPLFLPFAIESALAQTVKDFELFIVGDGVPLQTIDCAQEFARRDSRVKVFAFPKGLRVGETHLHHVLGTASGQYVAHIEDDDLWFPNHLDELEKLLRTADFGHTIHVWGDPDGRVESLSSDLSIPEYRQRFLNEKFNRIGYTVCGYRLDAYRRLPEGWAPSPDGFWPDLHMWRKFLSMAEFTFGTRMAITAIVLPTRLWRHVPVDDRVRKTRGWLDRILNERERAELVEAAWHSVVREGIQREMEFTASLGRMIEARDHFQAELRLMTASRDELGAERDHIVHSLSWRLTKPLRTVLTTANRVGRALRGHADS